MSCHLVPFEHSGNVFQTDRIFALNRTCVLLLGSRGILGYGLNIKVLRFPVYFSGLWHKGPTSLKLKMLVKYGTCPWKIHPLYLFPGCLSVSILLFWGWGGCLEVEVSKPLHEGTSRAGEILGSNDPCTPLHI